MFYLYSIDDFSKKNKALALLNHENIYISTQVLIEFSNILHKKLKLSFITIKTVIQELESNFKIHVNTTQTIRNATEIAVEYKYSWFDSLIISAALEAGCTTLYSEDMHHNQLVYNTLNVTNPFQ